MAKIGAVVMLGAGGKSPQEQLVTQAQRAATIDLIVMLKGLGISPIILCSPELSWWPHDIHIWLAPDPSHRLFHFGTHLAETIVANGLDQVLYFGGASAPLLDLPLLHLMLDLMKRAAKEKVVITNSIHSSDWLAISCVPEALGIIRTAKRDNSLAWSLREEGQYNIRVLTEIRPASGFDLDTPTDAAIIRYHPECKPYLNDILDSPLLDLVPIQPLVDTLKRPGSQIALMGRVGPMAWDALSRATQCWIRVFSEERGMMANNRHDRDEVHSLIGDMIALQGLYNFFQTLSGIVDAAIIDTRVLMAHQHLELTEADRFASDLYMVEAIENLWVREFTQAALEAPIPILLGGHSIVAGGLHVLSEILTLPYTTSH